ncbi:hypothetical protein [Micromonospora sp. NPDC047074]|uniref:hypothetical protein n=1 Tax=Micromonospora sp. NPDC047074 TaxID=3154339 RepID=UPI0033D5368D
MTDRQQQVALLVADAARRAVARYVPEELEVFDGVAAAWREGAANAARQSSPPGGGVGFGIDTVLVSELFLQAAAAAVGEVLVLGTAGVGAGIRARWRRRRGTGRGPVDPAGVPGPAEAALEAAPAADARVPVTGAGAGEPLAGPIALTGPQVAQLREACRRHALALGLPPDAADLLADATVGAMVAPGNP